MTRKLTFGFFTFFILALTFASTNARATSLDNAHDVAKTTVKAPVAATNDESVAVAKTDDKAKPAPTPKPKPKPGPRDDGDGD